MTALGISAGLCYTLAMFAFIGFWLSMAPTSRDGSVGGEILFGAGITLLIAGTFIHGLRSKLDELIAAISQRVDAQPVQAAPSDERDAAWLVRPKSKS
jgi:hypothetical protein